MSGKALGFGAELERPGNSGVEVGRLFPHALWDVHVRLGSVHEIKSENIFPAAGTDMKAITVIGGIRKVRAITEGLP
jgi:hypothetical protein